MCKGVGEMLMWLTPLMSYADGLDFNLFKRATNIKVQEKWADVMER